nr:MAG TPA: hypothetical protein [Caudoviricetes sp.]DAX71059.1 MAG TPA: hypothetical protein [Caudoviricetes sp.]
MATPRRKPKEKGLDRAGKHGQNLLPTDINTTLILCHVGRQNASKIPGKHPGKRACMGY